MKDDDAIGLRIAKLSFGTCIVDTDGSHLQDLANVLVSKFRIALRWHVNVYNYAPNTISFKITSCITRLHSLSSGCSSTGGKRQMLFTKCQIEFEFQ